MIRLKGGPVSRVEEPSSGVLSAPPLSLQDWEVQYQQDTPVAPRFDVNAPDLYIPGFTLSTTALHLSPSGWAYLGQRFRYLEAQMVLL